MKINFYTSLLCYAILFNTMNPMFNYYYLIFTAYLLWVFSVATTPMSRYYYYGYLDTNVQILLLWLFGHQCPDSTMVIWTPMSRYYYYGYLDTNVQIVLW